MESQKKTYTWITNYKNIYIALNKPGDAGMNLFDFLQIKLKNVSIQKKYVYIDLL